MKRVIITSILTLSVFTLYAQTSPFVESGTVVINNGGFKPTSIRVVPLTRPTPMHIHTDPVNATFPARFVVAKIDLATSGTWAWACGWNTAANTTISGVAASVIPTGCAAYFEAGVDAIVGKWRVPTQREFALIVISRLELAQNPTFVQLGASRTYWTSTQQNPTQSWALTLSGSSMYMRGKTLPFFVRCVRDL